MIKIEVFYISDRQWRKIEETDEEFYELFECDLVEKYFLTIDNFGEHIDESTKAKCTSFYSGGMEYITPLQIDDFIKLLFNKDETDESNRQQE